MKGSDFMNTDNEKIMIDKYQYEDFKEYDDLLSLDLAIKIYDGGTNASLNTGTQISIYSYDKYNIQIEGKEHHIKSITLFNKIKKLISDNFDTLVLFSKMETKEFISKNMLIGCSRNITIKYGQLLISINGAINGNIGKFCKEFIEEIKKLIINEGEKTQEDYMMELFEKYEPQTPTPLDEEFDKYCKLYKERFGKRAYIPEPSGTKEFVIECIKKCLDENNDMLDDLYYPNFKKDMENGVLYSETKKDINNDKFVWKEGEIKIAKTLCEFCKHNDKEHPSVCSQYPNGKPNEVINNNIKCPRFDKQNIIEL